MKYVTFCMIVIQTLVFVLVAISRPDNMQFITRTHCEPNFNLLSLGLMDSLKAATPLSALNSVRDFSTYGHASANFKDKIGVLYETPELRLITTTNSILKS